MDAPDDVDEDEQLLNYTIQLSLQESYSNDLPARLDSKIRKRKAVLYNSALLLTFLYFIF